MKSTWHWIVPPALANVLKLALRHCAPLLQKPSLQDKARAKTAVLAGGVQEHLAKFRENLTVKDVSPTLSADPRHCPVSTHSRWPQGSASCWHMQLSGIAL